jgi:hypothetical protein
VLGGGQREARRGKEEEVEEGERVGPVICVGRWVELATASMAGYHIRRALHRPRRIFLSGEGLDRQGWRPCGWFFIIS